MKTSQASARHPLFAVPRSSGIVAGLVGSFLLRTAGAAGGASVALYLSSLNKAGHEISPITLGLLIATFFAVELVLSPVLGGLSDRIGRRPLLVIGPLIGVAAAQIFPLTTAVPLFFLAQLLSGLSTAATLPATLGYLADVTTDSPDRTRIMGLFEVASLVGIAAGLAGAAALWGTLGTTIFHGLLPIYLICALIFGLGLRDVQARTTTRRSRRDYLAILRSPRIMRFVPAWIAINAVLGLWNAHAIFQLTGAPRNSTQALMGNFTSDQISLFLLAYMLAFGVGIYVAGVLATRLRRGLIMNAAIGGLFLATICLWLLNHGPSLGLPAWAGPVLFGLFLLGVFVESWFTPVALAYLADSSEHFAQSRGVVMGLYAIFLGVGQIIGNTLGGVFTARAGIDGMLLLTSLLGLVVLANLHLLHER